MTWLAILAVGAGSFLFRLGPQLVLQRVTLSERADQVIRHGGTSAITALIVVSVRSTASGDATWPTLLAVAAGAALAARGASMVRLLAFGGGIYAVAVLVVNLLGQ